ncbi:MAG: DUF1330 domain-containing protein [Gemmatimonadales bacterium]
MSAYVIGLVEISDLQQYREYMKHTPRLIHQFGGRFLARGGEVVTFEGEPLPRMVLIEFPSLDQARAFYDSPEYVRARQLRQGAGHLRLTAIQGYSPEEWDEAVRESSRHSV